MVFDELIIIEGNLRILRFIFFSIGSKKGISLPAESNSKRIFSSWCIDSIFNYFQVVVDGVQRTDKGAIWWIFQSGFSSFSWDYCFSNCLKDSLKQSWIGHWFGNQIVFENFAFRANNFTSVQAIDHATNIPLTFVFGKLSKKLIGRNRKNLRSELDSCITGTIGHIKSLSAVVVEFFWNLSVVVFLMFAFDSFEFWCYFLSEKSYWFVESFPSQPVFIVEHVLFWKNGERLAQGHL